MAHLLQSDGFFETIGSSDVGGEVPPSIRPLPAGLALPSGQAVLMREFCGRQRLPCLHQIVCGAKLLTFPSQQGRGTRRLGHLVCGCRKSAFPKQSCGPSPHPAELLGPACAPPLRGFAQTKGKLPTSTNFLTLLNYFSSRGWTVPGVAGVLRRPAGCPDGPPLPACETWASLSQSASPGCKHGSSHFCIY